MNIILIGMPGCGKTTIGKQLAERMGREFLDSDAYVEEKSGTTITEIFENNGENGFRSLETQALKDLCEMENTVISTGGGCVERKENIDILRENGVVVFIDRSVENIFSDIDVSGRPLLADKKERLKTIYERRFPLYTDYCHVRIKNDGSIEEAVEKIIKELEKI